jgi:catechol 2,3-dioxygenase-like lactoylglutathione lyase family enzyme
MTTEILFPHTAIFTPRLSTSVDFYRAFFGIEPKKIKPHYAKFELQNPRWNFTLNEIEAHDIAKPQVLSHLGFQVASTDDVRTIQSRLKELGILPTLEESGSTCCYAVQDKFWVTSPEGIEWEIFTVHADADVFRDDTPTSNACCAPSLEPVQLALPTLTSGIK